MSGSYGLDDAALAQGIKIPTGGFSRKLYQQFEACRYKYGAVEFDMDETGTVILNVEPGLDYLAECDERELARWRRGDHTIDAAQSVISSAALTKLAETRLAYYDDEYSTLRNDEGRMHDHLVWVAENSPLSVPDEAGSIKATAANLLASPAFLAYWFRITMHNILLRRSMWLAIVEFLRDIQKLDDEEGVYCPRRILLMSYVKNLLFQLRDLSFQELKARIFMDDRIKGLTVRLVDFEGYSGARLGIRGSPLIAKQLMDYKSLDGALHRITSSEDIWRGNVPTIERHVQDLQDCIRSAGVPPETLFKPEFLDSLTVLEQILDLIMLKGADNRIPPCPMSDPRFLQVASGGRQSQAVMEGTKLERHIKSSKSFLQFSTLSKIWKDIEDMALKKYKKSYEKIFGFIEFAPQWTDFPSPPPTSAVLVQAEAPSVVLPPRRERAPPHAKTEPLPGPSSSTVAPRPVVVECTPVTESDKHIFPPAVSEKVKTRGVPGQDISLSDLRLDETVEVPPSRPTFSVGKHYGVFERLLGSNGSVMPWRDFEAAMCQGMKFSKKCNGGSEITFMPADTMLRDVVFHRKDELYRNKISRMGRRLHDFYDWELDMFNNSRAVGEKDGELDM